MLGQFSKPIVNAMRETHGLVTIIRFHRAENETIVQKNDATNTHV